MIEKLHVGLIVVLALVCSRIATAEPNAADFSRAIVSIETKIAANGRTVATLGSTRRGSAVLIDASGLMVTIGYLVLEADSIRVILDTGETVAAELVANHHLTGLALLRAELPADIQPILLGKSEDIGVDQDVVVLNHGGPQNAHVARIASVREFAGSWEYFLDRAFYTTPAIGEFSGAALLDRDARLVGIGSLLLSDIYAGLPGASRSGNLFIPIEHLRAHLGSLLTNGTARDDRPWLGVTLNERLPDLQVVRVAIASPAAVAGLQAEDALLAINDKRVVTMRDFYQTLWQAGEAGVEIKLLISRDGQLHTLHIETASRDSWLVE